MAISIREFKSPSPIRWQWPLKVGVPAPLKSLQQQLQANKWPLTFAPVTAIRKNDTGHFNIIFLDAQIKFQDVILPGSISADVVMLLQKTAEQPLSNLQNLAEYFQASGVFLLSVGNAADWFSQLVVELSHNQNIINAISNTGVQGVVLYDTRLETETTLAFVIDRMIHKLRTPDYANTTFQIQTRFTTQTKFQGYELADLLEAHANQFVYISEGGDATDLNEISKPVFAQLGPRFFEERRMAMAKPPGGTAASPPSRSGGTMTHGDDDLLGAAPPGAAKPRKAIKKGVKKSRIRIAPKKAAPKKGIPKAKSRSVKKAARPASGGSGSGVSKKSAGRKSRKPSTAKPAAAPVITEVSESEARYLQAKFQTKQGKDYKEFLRPKTNYKVEVFIGYKEASFTSAGKEFDAETVFRESKQKEEPIYVEFKSNFNDASQFKEIKLPREGNSTSAKFDFTTNASSKVFKGMIFAYHQNRLIQQVELTAPVTKTSTPAKGKNLVMKVVVATRKSLKNLSGRTKFEAGIQVELGKKKSSRVHGISNNQPVDLYFADGLKEKLMVMKNAIEEALIDFKKHPADLTAKGNQELLYRLAMQGNLIYTNHLRNSLAPDGPLQIVTNQQNYVPLDFVYSKNPPIENAVLCKHAKEALNDGACKNCFDQSLNPTPNICPFGFWSFSRIIERHSYQKRKNNRNSDYTIVSEPQSNRATLQLLQRAIYASSKRVETDQTRGILKEIATCIHKNVGHSDEAMDWDTWTNLVRNEKPDSLILIVHIEKDKKVDIDKIEIGDNKFLLQNYFGPKVILKDFLKPPPFVIIIGCESSNIKNSGFDVSAQLINEGAAIVLSNFTKIRGRQAKDIVIRLLEFLKQGGKNSISFGEVMLKLRQKLMSEGLMASLSLVAQGDADWKIKT